MAYLFLVRPRIMAHITEAIAVVQKFVPGSMRMMNAAL
jgi:hypothetical protein